MAGVKAHQQTDQLIHWNCVLKIDKQARTSHCGSIKSGGISVCNLFKVSADTSGWSRLSDRLDTCTAPVCHRRTSGGVKYGNGCVML